MAGKSAGEGIVSGLGGGSEGDGGFFSGAEQVGGGDHLIGIFGGDILFAGMTLGCGGKDIDSDAGLDDDEVVSHCFPGHRPDVLEGQCDFCSGFHGEGRGRESHLVVAGDADFRDGLERWGFAAPARALGAATGEEQKGDEQQ